MVLGSVLISLLLSVAVQFSQHRLLKSLQYSVFLPPLTIQEEMAPIYLELAVSKEVIHCQ